MVDQPKSRNRGPWVHLLGTVPDRVIAEQAGVSTGTVCTWRKTLGIPPCRKHVGRTTGRTTARPEWYALLGTLPDREVAERAGVTKQAVSAARIRLGIPRVSGHVANRAGWVAKVASRLGVESDATLAREVGVCDAAVRQERLRRGIPAVKGRRPPAEGTQLAAILAVLRVSPVPMKSADVLEAAGIRVGAEDGKSRFLFRTHRLRTLRRRGFVVQVGRDLWTVPGREDASSSPRPHA